jgi:hypothetical protein
VSSVLEKNNDLDCVVPAREHKHHSGNLFNRSSEVRIEQLEHSRSTVRSGGTSTGQCTSMIKYTPVRCLTVGGRHCNLMTLPWRIGPQPPKRLHLDLRHAFLRCGGHVQRRTPQPNVAQTSAKVGAHSQECMPWSCSSLHSLALRSFAQAVVQSHFYSLG